MRLRSPRSPATIAGMLVVAVVMGGCLNGATSQPSGASGSPRPVELTIYAAASLRDALVQVVSTYEGEMGVTLTVSTGSSAALEAQIEQGAPADVFLSADVANPQKVVDAGLAAGDLVPFAANGLVVVVPAANPAAIQSPADLATPGVKIIAAGDDVPISRYVAELLANLATEPGYPADVGAAYAANVVSKEEDVRAVVSKIEIGEGDAAIVYATEATTSVDVATVRVPETADVTATYAGVAIGGSLNATAAADFLEWLAGPAGRAMLADFGFAPAP